LLAGPVALSIDVQDSHEGDDSTRRAGFGA
jgi:hypothetical protein